MLYLTVCFNLITTVLYFNSQQMKLSVIWQLRNIQNLLLCTLLVLVCVFDRLSINFLEVIFVRLCFCNLRFSIRLGFFYALNVIFLFQFLSVSAQNKHFVCILTDNLQQLQLRHHLVSIIHCKQNNRKREIYF